MVRLEAAHGRMVVVNRRLFAGSIAVAVVVAIAGGWALSRGGDDGDDTSITMDSAGVVQDPTIGTNAPVDGEPLPVVTLTDFEGNDVDTGSLVGGPLVINFWNTTCVPCQKEMPVLGATAEALDGKVRFVGVNNLPDVGDPAGFAADHGADYLQLSDGDSELLVPVGVGVLPATVFVDASGQIVLLKSGELTQAKLDAAITEAFGELS